MQNDLLRSIPKTDLIISHTSVIPYKEKYGNLLVTECAREVTEELRKGILEGRITEVCHIDVVAEKVIATLQKRTRMNLKPVINATGIVLHTNLGRAVLSDRAAKAAYEVAKNYSNLEYDCEKGERGSRLSHVGKLLQKLCGCESVCVVNNNAAAMLLVLSAVAKDREVIVSRGELVEIGGSFRIPEIMSLSGAYLSEVGTTNKTHSYDYINAINPEKTAAFLKVHTSNYKILGFTEEVSLSRLVEIGRERNVPVIYDLGSGAFFDTEESGLEYEPNIRDSIGCGADIVCFSGDKLLGGPQAGIIAGKKKYIDAMKSHPLARALRVDKMTLAALEATLLTYLDPQQAIKQIPTLKMLTQSKEELYKKAESLQVGLSKNPKISTEIIEDTAQVGGGSMPTQEIAAVCVAVTSPFISLNKLDEKLRLSNVPIIGRISKERYLLDVRCVEEKDFEYICETFKQIFE